MKGFFLIGAVAALTMSYAVTAVAQDTDSGVFREHRTPEPTSGEAPPGEERVPSAAWSDAVETSFGGDGATVVSGGPAGWRAEVGLLRGDGSPDIERLRNEYQRLENQAANIAVQVRDQLQSRKINDNLDAMYQASPPGSNPLGSRKSENETKRLQDLLKKLVGGAFDARQRLQQAEIAAGREQLHRIEQSIQSNERSREERIEQRVKELLDPRTADNTSTDGSKSDLAEMILRMTWRDPVSTTRLSIRGAQAQELLKVIQKANPSITYSLDNEVIVVRGLLNDLKLLRQRLQALGQSEAAEGFPPGFMVASGQRLPLATVTLGLLIGIGLSLERWAIEIETVLLAILRPPLLSLLHLVIACHPKTTCGEDYCPDGNT